VNHVERFAKVMAFESVDRLPMIEWAGWWDLTVGRWHEEGLPAELTDAAEIRAHLGLDCYRQLWLRTRGETCPEPAGHGAGLAWTMDDYVRLLPHLYPHDPFDRQMVRAWGERQRAGEMVVWITLDGFFWYPRTILGIAAHLYAFYDAPELMHDASAQPGSARVQPARAGRVLRPLPAQLHDICRGHVIQPRTNALQGVL
jgi:hypothetical protein